MPELRPLVLGSNNIQQQSDSDWLRAVTPIGVWQYIVKSSDQTVSNTTTPTADTEFRIASPVNFAQYEIQLFGLFTRGSSTTANCSIGIYNSGAAGTGVFRILGQTTSSQINAVQTYTFITTGSQAHAYDPIYLRGIVTSTNSSNPLELRFCPTATGSTNSVTNRKGSIFRYRRLTGGNY